RRRRSPRAAPRAPPLPSRREGPGAGRCPPGRADRLAHLAHLLHQVSEPLMLCHLPLRLLQLRPRLQVHVHRLAADTAGQVPLRAVPPVPRLRAGTVRLAAPAPHRVQRAPPEVPDLGHQPEQLGAAALQPRQVTPGEISHARLPSLSVIITQASRAACTNQAPSRFSRAPKTGPADSTADGITGTAARPIPGSARTGTYRLTGQRAEGRGAAWTEEGGATKERRATREGGVSGEGRGGGWGPEASQKAERSRLRRASGR